MVMVGARRATAVERLAVLVADRVDRAVLAEHQEMTVDGRQADLLTAPAQLGVDVLRAAEPREILQSTGQRLGLPRAAHPGAPGRLWRPHLRKVAAFRRRAALPRRRLARPTAEAIGREAGVKVEAGQNSLYGDTLGPAGSAGATYLAMERHNTTTIVTALKG
jgi:hypothetical protein